MNERAKRERDLAWRLLRREVGDDHSPEALAQATQQSFDRLYRRLVELVGPAGFDALARRSLSLAKAECPFLERVVAELQPDAYRLRGLQTSVQGRDASEVREGLIALLGAFFWLLDTFVGDSLFWKLLRGVWPHLPAEMSRLDSEEMDA